MVNGIDFIYQIFINFWFIFKIINSLFKFLPIYFIPCYKHVVPPKITAFQFGDEALNSGEPASVQCTISGGDWPIDVSWTLNGRSIGEYLDVATTKFTKYTYALAIDAVGGHHAGNYTCRAQNRAGVMEYTAQLVVNGLFDRILKWFNYFFID